VLDPLPASYTSTREAMHALAEHVLASARYRVDGHIGLMPTSHGFGTPLFGDGERVRVDGIELVHERPGTTTRVGITTLGDAARFLGIPGGAPTEVYKPVTAFMPDAPLGVDSAAAAALAAWFAFVAQLVEEVVEEYRAQPTSTLTIWPEGFDCAVEIGDEGSGTRANYGGSPGDGGSAEPYLYVGPWDESRRAGRLGSHPWGAGMTYDELLAAGDPRRAGREFFSECASLLLGEP
jgi:hypothetical protein